MEKVEETEQKRRKKLKKHSTGQRIICGLLCICLSMASLSGFNYNLLVFAASGQEMQPEIVSFVDLPDEIKMQKVDLGTSWEELKLPDTLTAVVSPIEREKNVTYCWEEHNVSSNMENVNTVTINNIEWTSNAPYNSERNNTYILTPILPQKYKLMEDIKLPEINIIVEEVELEAGNGEQKEQIEEENTVKAHTEEYTENKEENPDKEYATGNNVKDKENESKEENLKEAKQEETIENKNGKENQRKEKIENEEENTESKSGKENQRKEETENKSIESNKEIEENPDKEHAEGSKKKENVEETEKTNIEQGEIQKDEIDKNRVEEETEKTRTDKQIDKVKRDTFLRDDQQEIENSDNKEETEQTTMPISETEPSCGTIQADTTWSSGRIWGYTYNYWSINNTW